jgi:hypothetical protein
MIAMRASLSHKHPGFITIVVMGLLAILFVLAVGFLSYTRSELSSVSLVRLRTDANNAAWSAIDWTLSNISHDLCSGGVFDKSKFVAHIRQKDGAGHLWWYKPIMGSRTYSNAASQRKDEICDFSDYVNLPDDFLPGGYKARVAVQVWDTNGAWNINDWMNDANPSQCQMAHMYIDGAPENYMERERGAFLTVDMPMGTSVSETSRINGGSVLSHEICSFSTLTPVGGAKYAGNLKNYRETCNLATPCPYHQYPKKPWRYYDAWRLVTHTASFYQKVQTHTAPDIYSPEWADFVTSNEPYFTAGALSASVEAISAEHKCDRDLTTAPSPGNSNQPIETFPKLTTYSHVDPDTGRSPINVNTGIPPKGTAAANWNGMTSTIAAVFNTESLRRIVKIGNIAIKVKKVHFQSPPPEDKFIAINAKDLYELNLNNNLDPVTDFQAKYKVTADFDFAEAKRKVEEHRTRIAYEYQETLCTYFTSHVDARAFHPLKGAGADGTYVTRYQTVLTNGEANKVKYFAPLRSLTLPVAPFPYGVEEFRSKVKEDLKVMALPFTASSPHTDEWAARQVWDPVALANVAFPIQRGDGCVDVDDRGPTYPYEIPPGRLDARTASAIYDNIVPGRAFLYDEGESNGGFAVTANEREPIWELYQMRLGRDETQTAQYFFPSREGPGTVGSTPANPSPRYGWATRNIGLDTGKDIAKSGAAAGTAEKPSGPWTVIDSVPDRQLVCGPDCFSTELTTASTSFMIIVEAQIVHTPAGATTPQLVGKRNMAALIEIAPDIMDETTVAGAAPADWATTGLGYYRGDWPRKRTTDVSVMGNDLSVPASPKSTAAILWVDYRGVKDGAAAATFYSGGSGQTRKRPLIRGIFDFTMSYGWGRKILDSNL